jgi:hypothetical protein
MKKLLRDYRDEDIEELDRNFFDFMDKLRKEKGISKKELEKMGQEAINEMAGEFLTDPKLIRRNPIKKRKVDGIQKKKALKPICNPARRI